jgi:hypothetical protein
MFYVAFFGSVNAIFHVLIFTGIFGVGAAFYNRWRITGKELKVALTRYFALNIASGLSLLFLGAWIFYSIYLEMSAVGYSRDPNYSPASFFFMARNSKSRWSRFQLFSRWVFFTGFQLFRDKVNWLFWATFFTFISSNSFVFFFL